MSSTVAVVISTNKPTSTAWKASSAVILGDSGATIYLGEHEADNLRKIQKAGRQLDAMGVVAVSLQGSEWNLERQWAFAKGYSDTLSKNRIQWAGDAEQLDALQSTAAWVRRLINLPPNEIYPESLAQQIARSEEHTSELQSRPHLVCRLLLEKKKK